MTAWSEDPRSIPSNKQRVLFQQTLGFSTSWRLQDLTPTAYNINHSNSTLSSDGWPPRAPPIHANHQPFAMDPTAPNVTWPTPSGLSANFHDLGQAQSQTLDATSLANDSEAFAGRHSPAANFAGAELNPDLSFELSPTANYSHFVSATPSNTGQQGLPRPALENANLGLMSQDVAELLQAYEESQLVAPQPLTPLRSASLDSSAPSEWPEFEGINANGDDDTATSFTATPDEQITSKKKVARRQGVTCDQCRSKHLRCDLDDRQASQDKVAQAAIVIPRPVGPGKATQLVHAVKCSRCEEKGFLCTKTHAPPSRRYPRPSRTGKRIEQARLMHGSLGAQEAASRAPAASRINASTILLGALVELRRAEVRITDRVMAGSLSLQLLNCFFAIAHMQTPVVDFEHFSYTFNVSNGDPRKMSIMSNGGSEEEALPSALPRVTALEDTHWPGTRESKVGTPGTTETLIAVMHAWAACYTDVPIAFGSEAKELERQSAKLSELGDQDLPYASGDVPTETKNPQRRPKRKQGVACDTCRLRRVRCDLTERPEGLGCSRCEDKKIKCTDDYIQAKKSKGSAGARKPDSPGSVNATESLAMLERSSSNNSSRADGADKLSPRQWISSKRESIMRAYSRGDTAYNLRRGKARKAFCHALLNHAVSLVHKHNMLDKPSIEAAQALTLLAPLLDSVDPNQAFMFADTASAHLVALGVVTRHVVNESDQVAVEGLFANMQRSRLYLTTWCRDAITSGLNRRQPYFEDDRAIDVMSDRGGPGLAGSNGAAEMAQRPRLRNGEVVLSGEMGLTFVFMAQVQIGALSRFIAVHIDRLEGSKPSIPPWQKPANAPTSPTPPSVRFPARPTLVQVQRLERACNAVWNSIDSLILFFDRCAAKARLSMDKVKPFRPLGWIAATKISGCLLYLTIIRVLGERYKTNAGYLAAMAQTYGSASISPEDREVARGLKELFDRGMQKALSSCRRTARLVEVLLPLGVFQTGGLLLKQIFPVAQFLARIPSIPNEAVAGLRNAALSGAVSQVDQQPSFVDPQSLSHRPSASATMDANQWLQPQTQLPTISPIKAAKRADDRVKGNDPFEEADPVSRAELGPFTHSAKFQEVEACIEGLSQLGYAWDTMDREIDAIRGILESQNM
ncbi:hypothetical protein ACQY0O_004338 [Thecaphora frezii]